MGPETLPSLSHGSSQIGRKLGTYQIVGKLSTISIFESDFSSKLYWRKIYRLFLSLGFSKSAFRILSDV